MSVNLICIFGCSSYKGVSDSLKIIIRTNAVNHLISCNKCEIVGDCAEAGVSYNELITVICIISALTKFAVKHSEVFFADLGSIKLRAGNKFKFLGFATDIIGIKPQPSLMISLKHKDVLFIFDRDKEVKHLGVLNSPIDIITEEYVELVVFKSAVEVKIILKCRIATVNVSNMVDFLIFRQINALEPDLIQFVRLYYFNTCRNLLCSKP